MLCLCTFCFKRYLWLALFLAFFLLRSAHGSTLLFSHQGAANPTTQGWTFSGTVQTGAVVNDQESGIDAWRVYEQGGTNAGTYNKTLTTTQLSDALSTGWTLDATIRYVPPDDLIKLDPTNNAWCTLLIDEGVAGKRDLYGLYFGNDAEGNTDVRLFGASQAFKVTPGYHDYQLIWDPSTSLASFYIDGELKLEGYGGGTIDNTGTSRVYWGDNTTTNAAVGRGAHYSYVGLTIGTAVIPEPNRMCLFVMGAGTLLRRRRP